jgi:uncharacterized protein
MSNETSNRRISPALARILPFAAFMAFIVMQSAGGDWIQSRGLDPRWLYPIRTVTVALLLVVFWRHYTELHSLTGMTLRNIALALGSGALVFWLWINLDFEWAVIGKPSPFDPTLPDGSGINWVLVCSRLVGLVIVVPIMEELFWRSFLMRWIDRQDFLLLEPQKVGLRAIIISSLIFASEHSMWFAGLLAGLVYAMVYVWTRNLWLPVLSHALTNGVLGCWIVATRQWQFW